MKKLLVLTLVIGAVACSSHQEKKSDSSNATAELTGPNVDLNSDIKLVNVGNGVSFTADVKGLKPGSIHGFHIHEKGSCIGPDFKSAGDHYNPRGHSHGSPKSSMNHVGDLGNLVVDKNGEGVIKMIIPNENVETLIGKSLVLHAKADDFSTQPSGNSGDRIACGIIK